MHVAGEEPKTVTCEAEPPPQPPIFPVRLASAAFPEEEHVLAKPIETAVILLGFKSQLCRKTAAPSQMDHLSSLYLHFLINTIGVTGRPQRM